MADEDFPCRPRAGRALAWLRIRYVALDKLDRLAHRLHIRPAHNECSGLWPCFEYDDVWLERLVHDQQFHHRARQHMTRVEITEPPTTRSN